MNNFYWVACRETGEKIECFKTIEEAKNRITQFENEDKENGDFTPDFYDVVDDEFMHIDF